MQGTCNHVPETSNNSRVHNVAAVLWLQFMVHVMLNGLYFYINTFRSKCAVTSMTIFCSYLI